jgi:hypothetical protein
MIWKTTKILLLALFVSCTLCQASDYKAHFRQEKDSYTLNKDRTNLPFKDAIGDPNGAFLIEEYDETKSDEYIEEQKNMEREFSAEDFYTVLVPGNDNSLVSDHVYHLTAKTKGFLNYHCMNRHERACKIDVEIFDGNHNVLYRSKDKQQSALKVVFKARGDIYIRFLNTKVSHSRISHVLTPYRKDQLECSSPSSASNVESGTRSSSPRTMLGESSKRSRDTTNSSDS